MNSINSQGLPARMIPIAISVAVIFVFILFTPTISCSEEPFFSIALSKFSNEEAAKKEEAKLKNAGNNAFYKKEKNPENGNIEYQVYIEKYSSMDEAIKEAKVLKELDIISNYLVKEVADKPIEEEILAETPPEGSEIPQPADDTKQITGAKSEVIEKKEPASDLKIADDKAPLTAKKDVDIKIPEKEAIKTATEAAPKEQLEKSLVPEQERISGQIKRGAITVKKEAIKQPTLAEKPAEQAALTDQKVANENILKPENVETQKQVPEPIPEKNEGKKAFTNPVKEEKTGLKEVTPEVIIDEASPEKADKALATQTPEMKRVEPEKKIPAKKESMDQVNGATLQVGACKEEANAAILKKQLLSLGRKAFYRYETVEGMGEIYRIYVTGYKTLGEAVKDAKTLVESGVITGYARVHSGIIPVTAMPPQKADAVKSETGGKIFFLHTGSFKEEVNAQRVVASLKESGYKAFYVPEKEPSVTWFRVYIGDFRSETQAREKGLELLDKGVITYFKPIAIDPQEKDN